MAQGRSTKIISMIKCTRTSRLSIKISLSLEKAEKGRVRDGSKAVKTARERATRLMQASTRPEKSISGLPCMGLCQEMRAFWRRWRIWFQDLGYSGFEFGVDR